ncbi:MAG TPA: hypothetical protein VNO33_11285, partial [Kofleriaceae bacterium]|nr:hypothetical protein [Kofleriaceae bacterium]
MKRLAIASLVLGLAGCGAGREVVPRLPGDGSQHTARPRKPGSGTEADLWAGRDLIDPPRPVAAR